MKFIDIPSGLSESIYEEAILTYSQKVKTRSVALYTVGEIAFPGISDLDLLVVVDSCHADNNQFFSVNNRLPKRFHKLFLHQPFIVPLSSIGVLGHTSHGGRRLITGGDVLAGIEPSRTATERWCKLFESYRNFELFRDQIMGRSEAGRLSGRLMVAVASSMRYALRDLDAILGTDTSTEYADAIDSFRRELINDIADRAQPVREMWKLLRNKLDWLAKTLSESLQPSGETVAAFSAEFLKGKRFVLGTTPDEAKKRRLTIDRYHCDLHKLKFSYGYLFFLAAYGDSFIRYKQSRFTNAWLSLPYKLRRESRPILK